MKIHKEGYATLIIVIVFLAITNFSLSFFLDPSVIITYAFAIASVLFFFFIMYFFRRPVRIASPDDSKIISPADGKVVIIGETFVEEYFNKTMLQVSIFMSPFNIHSNFNPVTGLVKYFKYHPGRFLVAWLPKSSVFNEHTTYVIETKGQKEIMIRQIAGFVARRIVYYQKEGDKAIQGKEYGFIKFGSRIDLFLPTNTKILVKLNQKVKATKSLIAEI